MRADVVSTPTTGGDRSTVSSNTRTSLTSYLASYCSGFSKGKHQSSDRGSGVGASTPRRVLVTKKASIADEAFIVVSLSGSES
jgi:hypothetical protein